jgi:hypothetical protein
MAIFSGPDQLYDCLRDLFAQLQAGQPDAAESLLKSRLCLQFVCADPQAVFTIDARQRPLAIIYGQPADGAGPAKANLEVQVTADVLHQILLGELTLTKALGSKQLVPRGPIWKATALADLFYHAQKVYPQVAAARGLR